MNEAPKVRSLAAIRLELEELSREVEEFARDLIDSGHANAPTYAAASATIRAATTIQAHVRVGAHIRAEAHVIQAEPEQSSLPVCPALLSPVRARVRREQGPSRRASWLMRMP